MAVSFKLSPMSSYYLRRLVQAHKDMLLSSGDAEFTAAMIQLDPEGMLSRVGLSEGEIAQRVKELEVLTRAHQSLSSSGTYPQELKDVETQIFTQLGWNISQAVASSETGASEAVALTGVDALTILQDLFKTSAAYLGGKISGDYLKGSCPVEDWVNQLTIQKGNVLELSSLADQTLNDSELASMKTWVIQFIQKCSTIIGGFHEIANQDDFKALRIDPAEIESS
jgi:hypothetical protein